MKKVGLCVRYDCNNYGSMLQILATQEAIKKVGWSYEIIRYDKKTPLFLIMNITRVFNPYFMRGKIMNFSKKRKLNAHIDIKQKNSERLRLFLEYRKKYIGPYSRVCKGYKNLVKFVGEYDAVMVGSDQLWTPAGIKSKFYNLLFVPDSIKKVSLATSFGVSEIPASQRKETKKYLKRIDCLSVREIQGKKIIKELTGRDALVALDPTLLLSGSDWEQIFPVEKIEKEPYIFAYFLGKNPAHRDEVEKLKKVTGLKIVTCPHMDEFVEGDESFGDEKRYDVNPIDFLNLIRGAEYICTDSFHGSVFSILNHKKFLTFNRFDESEKQSRNSRIDSLFELLGLNERRYKKDIVEEIQQEISYSDVDSRLVYYRNSTFEFLDSALNGD